ncbi:MAG: phosphoribosylaminoimidazolesuccinocarboxamide synthase [Alphaproteobacteria bacterium]|nr:phosphoribosylaminoimidazolesuccinocarboxamide synthase [Alphaproteobacteria bacterium]
MPHALSATHLEGLGARHEGKVRDIYLQPGRRLLVATDRLSAFDRIIAAIPFKGQVLNQLSAWWFEHTADVVGNHVLDVPDPNVTVGREAQALPVEIVVRGYITGVTDTALWTLYDQGVDRPYGLDLPAGLRKNDRLPTPVITPTTKGGPGEHDERLSSAEVVSRGLVEPRLWAQVQEVALEVFRRGQERAAAAGLILVDTKYEMGLIDGRLVLIDEVHTPDSSRYWQAASYEADHAAGREPEGLDKEYVRRWLKSQGYAGEGPVPAPPADVVVELAARYIDAFERLTGQAFVPGAQPAEARLQQALSAYRA